VSRAGPQAWGHQITSAESAFAFLPKGKPIRKAYLLKPYMLHEIICCFKSKRVHNFNLMFQEIICLEHVIELITSDVYNNSYRNDTLTSLDIVNLDKCCSPYLVVGIKLGS
jgi:hypothetical protein